ncbi:hypothetical protein [Spiroplasma endosymbiont of Polydrusus formosus]|uniref:hypothetical protein n=1 Tax=Spiroplasma endosymbiont of Polydrusus formosus TaxID=3139326 RepID=UPI0035B546D7
MNQLTRDLAEQGRTAEIIIQQYLTPVKLIYEYFVLSQVLNIRISFVPYYHITKEMKL